jgi:hypothetical protein
LCENSLLHKMDFLREEVMKFKQLRVNIPADIYKKYRLICLEKDLSMPKQTTQLLKSFVEAQEETKRLFQNNAKCV